VAHESVHDDRHAYAKASDVDVLDGNTPLFGDFDDAAQHFRR